MTDPANNPVTLLLSAARRGDPHAAEQLLPIIYDELRRLAGARMNRLPARGAGYTLQPTALVHEAYIRLVTPDVQKAWDNRRHFFAAAAIAMRDILVERARQHASLKRGGDRRRAAADALADLEADPESTGIDLLALERALATLAERDPRRWEIVMLRFYAGLPLKDIARMMNCSTATIKREWTYARALLYAELQSSEASPDL
jgi:RNA polymerase sigma factor (TIGR02999 family)